MTRDRSRGAAVPLFGLLGSAAARATTLFPIADGERKDHPPGPGLIDVTGYFE